MHIEFTIPMPLIWTVVGLLAAALWCTVGIYLLDRFVLEPLRRFEFRNRPEVQPLFRSAQTRLFWPLVVLSGPTMWLEFAKPQRRADILHMRRTGTHPAYRGRTAPAFTEPMDEDDYDDSAED